MAKPPLWVFVVEGQADGSTVAKRLITGGTAIVATMAEGRAIVWTDYGFSYLSNRLREKVERKMSARSMGVFAWRYAA